MSSIIHPDWLEDLPANAREHVEDLEARVLDLCRRLERSRQRTRHLRAVNRDLKARLAAREKAPR